MEPALSVVIPTVGRGSSLRETIERLGLGERAAGAPFVEIVAVDNTPDGHVDPDRTLPVRHASAEVRLVHEPRPGKFHAMDRGIAESRADLLVILDDDMSPMDGWADAVIDSARRRPDFDIFAGRSHVVWPEGVPRPAWADHPLATGVAFSVFDPGAVSDREMGRDAIGFPSGNHFWFRRCVTESVPSFPELWAPEADYVVAARACGHRGVFVPEVSCGHRIQPELVDEAVFMKRARHFGRLQARVDEVMSRVTGTGRAGAVRRVKRVARAGATKAGLPVQELRALVKPRRTGWRRGPRRGCGSGDARERRASRFRRRGWSDSGDGETDHRTRRLAGAGGIAHGTSTAGHMSAL